IAPVATRVRAASAVISQHLLVWGGYGHFDANNPRRFGPCLDGAVYDVAKDIWEKMPAPPLPMANYGYVSCAGDGRFFLLGGRTIEAAIAGLLQNTAGPAHYLGRVGIR